MQVWTRVHVDLLFDKRPPPQSNEPKDGYLKEVLPLLDFFGEVAGFGTSENDANNVIIKGKCAVLTESLGKPDDHVPLRALGAHAEELHAQIAYLVGVVPNADLPVEHMQAQLLGVRCDLELLLAPLNVRVDGRDVFVRHDAKSFSDQAEDLVACGLHCLDGTARSKLCDIVNAP